MKPRAEVKDEYEPHLFLRLYAEVGTEAEARAVAQICLAHLQTCAPVSLHKVFPYWKIPEYFGMEFEFTLNDQATEAFECVTSLCPLGWTYLGNPPGRSRVWNPVLGSVLLNERVRWANLELFDRKKS